MVSLLDAKASGILFAFSRWAVSLSLGKSFRMVRNRIRLYKNLRAYLHRKRNTFGDAYVVKYLKVAHTCLARALARSPASSMMEIDDSFIFPRLTKSGLPKLIPSSDRLAIMRGRPGVIRLWMTFFGVYRVLYTAPKPKLSTITDGFTGS